MSCLGHYGNVLLPAEGCAGFVTVAILSRYEPLQCLAWHGRMLLVCAGALPPPLWTVLLLALHTFSLDACGQL